jgi:hypothetical protein
MPELVLLGGEVADVLQGGCGHQRDPRHDLEAIALEPPLVSANGDDGAGALPESDTYISLC